MKAPVGFQAKILAALAHPNRIRILEFMQSDVRCNCELAPALRLEQSNLSRHLKILVEAGILRSWKEGLRVNFQVTDERCFRILDTVSALGKRELARTAKNHFRLRSKEDRP